MKLRGTLLASTLLFVALDASAQDAKKKEAAMLELQVKVYNMLSGSSGAIDACTTAYTTEYPAADGKVQLEATVVKDGTVSVSTAQTTIDGARNLRPCLEKIAKGWKFPPLNKDGSEKMTLTIPVKKGTKFVLQKPGEKQGAAQQEQPEGFLMFLPESFLPAYGEGQ
jgi:hypothetical protein